MNHTDWERAMDLLDQALDLPEESRPAFLDKKCGDRALRQEVHALLAAERRAAPLDRPVGERFRSEEEPAPDSTVIGPYRILGEIGAGGMGRVYRAVRDDQVFRKQIALKILKRGMDTDEIVRRFMARKKGHSLKKA